MLLGDRLLLCVGTVLVGGAVTWAAVVADDGAAAMANRVRRSTRPPASEDSLPYNAARLPEGVRIDPDTLQLVGLVLEPEDGSVVVGWETLQRYEYQEDLVGMPSDIRALDGKKVTMAGFLLPIYEYHDIKEFNLVASHWSCCFGVPPGMSGWVRVVLERGHKGLENKTYPLRVTGNLRVVEHLEAGYVVSIYSIEDAKVQVIGW